MAENNEDTQTQAQSKKKLSIPDIRALAVKLNNPVVDVERRQRALTALFIMLCDRLTGGLARAIKQLTVKMAEIDRTLAEIMGVLAPDGAQDGAEMAEVAEADVGADVTEGDEPVIDIAAQAAAELASLPASMRPPGTAPAAARPAGAKPRRAQAAPSPVAPSAQPVTPPVTVADAAAVAAKMAGADGIPAVPLTRS